MFNGVLIVVSTFSLQPILTGDRLTKLSVPFFLFFSLLDGLDDRRSESQFMLLWIHLQNKEYTQLIERLDFILVIHIKISMPLQASVSIHVKS